MHGKNLLNLKKVFDEQESALKVELEMNLSEYKISNMIVFNKPVLISGEIKKSSGFLEIRYSATAKMNFLCDRCLKETSKPLIRTFTHELVEEVNEIEKLDERILCRDGILDMSDLVVSDIFLSLETKFLCSKDCKGICSGCGQDLNDGDCHCPKKEIDPRLAILQNYYSN